jgi:transcription elongation GreA/GreB family factor
MNTKQALLEYGLRNVEERISQMQEEIKQVQASANEETKSSAGDKYETQRSMAQLEVQRITQQLMALEKQRHALRALARTRVEGTVIPGSLVATSQGIFFISISLGRVELDLQPYYLISPDSPVGKLLTGKRAGESISFNRQRYDILRVE